MSLVELIRFVLLIYCMNVFFIIGLKRSGNHAIINWLYKMIPNYIHLNNMKISDINKKNYYSFKKNDDKIIDTNYCDKKWIPFTIKNNLIISFEDKDLVHLKSAITNFCNDLKISHNVIIILRSPLNNFASFWQIYKTDKSLLINLIERWKLYAIESLEKLYFNDACLIVYDKWFNDVKYRERLASELGLKFDDSNLNSIFKHGVSSFDGYNYINSAQNMDVLNRCKNFEADTDFKSFTSDPLIQEIWHKLKEKEKI